MSELVLLDTAWGPRHGGINSFNMDFARALGRLLGPQRVYCVTLEEPKEDEVTLVAGQVTLLHIGVDRNHTYFEASRADDVVRKLAEADFAPGEATWWIGHDAITGEVANHLVEVSGKGKSAVIHHMSFIDYQSFMYSDAQKARNKSDYQADLLRKSDLALAVGPFLLDSLRTILEPIGKANRAHMIVPGLAEIEPCREQLERFAGITFGRLSRANDRIKQVRLAVDCLCKRLQTPGIVTALSPSRGTSAVQHIRHRSLARAGHQAIRGTSS